MKRHLFSLLLCALLLAGCGTAELTSVSVRPTATPRPSSATPTATPIAPTSTPTLTITPLPPSSTPTTIPTESPTPRPLSQAGTTRLWEKDDSVMIYVPAGAFWIDRTEVTNAQYRRCVDAGICEELTICDWGAST